MFLKLGGLALVAGLVVVMASVGGSRLDRASATGGVVAISAGGSHTCLITESGTVRCWGYNSSGQLGIATPYSGYHPAPEDVVGLGAGVVEIVATQRHTCALLETGGVMCWGSTLELGAGAVNSTHPVDVIGLSNGVVALSPGSASMHTCAIDS